MKKKCPFCRSTLVDGGKAGELVFHRENECPMSGRGYPAAEWDVLRESLRHALFGKDSISEFIADQFKAIERTM